MKIIVAFALTFLITPIAYNQYWGSCTTSNYTNEAVDVETDNSGNLYVAGYITGETSFDINTVQTSVAGNGDIYVSKYASNGNLIWIKQFGGNFSDRPTDLVLGDANFIYITGQYFGQVTFGSFTLNSVNNSKDIFLVKLDAAGNVLWAISEGGSGSENAYGITTDNQNNLILTGQYQGNSTIAGQTFLSMTDPVTNLPSNDLFISKYNSSGNALWIQTGIAEYEDRGLALSCDSQDNIFMTGQFSDTMVFAGTTFNNPAYNVSFLCKFSPSGQLLWLNQLRAGMVMACDLEVNVFDEVVVIGDFIGNFIYQSPTGPQNIANPFSRKIFAMKVDNNGNYNWGVSLGSNNDISARTISIDAAKNSYISGYFKCDWSELHDNNTALFNSVGFKDAYLLKIDNAGNIVYTKQFGGKGNDEGHGVAILPNAQPVICGSHTQNLNIPNDYTGAYSTNNGSFHLNTYTTNIGYHYLQGDLSRNSFLTNSIHSNTPAYNYFYNTPSDSLDGFIASLFGNINVSQDTIDFCVRDSIYYDAQTYYQIDPDYTYLWNTGATTRSIEIDQSGIYSVYVERLDECSFGDDTVVGIRHELPLLPLMTDNLGIAINAPGPYYQYYNFCSPDSVQIWFSDLCPSCNIAIIPQYSAAIYTDTLPHFYPNESYYTVQISDSFCVNEGHFEVDLDYIIPYDTILPYHYFIEDPDLNDTITMCAQDYLHVHIYDSITNPNAIYNQFNFQPLVDSNWTITPYISETWWYNSHGYAYKYRPQSTGWYSFNYTATIGYDNLCGIDTVMYDITDSIYIIVNQLPTDYVTILGDNLLCPDGSAYLTVSDTISGFNWYGPGIAWQNSIGDSIQITIAGTYYYAGTLIDTVTLCSDSLTFSHTINLKQPPPILMNPDDGIVCPNDSVYMYINDIYLSYDWIGPEGFSLSSTWFHIDDDQGFYYCHVEDSSGCILTTAPAEIREFTTPSIFVEPSYVLCPGDQTTLTVTYIGNAQIQWTSPIISNSPVLNVSQTGTYVCEIQQCGMTFLDSVEILDGSFQISLNASDTLLCYDENSILSTSPGLGDYQWNDGTMGVNTNVVTDAGLYFVNATNQYGCTAYSDSIQIEIVEGSFPPDIADLSICPGEDASLSEIFGNAVNWYDTDSTFILNNSSITINSLFSDTSFLAAYDIALCPPAYAIIEISILDSLALNAIIGDSILCPGSSSTYTLENNQDAVSWYVDGIIVSSADSITYTAPSSSPANQTIMAVISNSCFSDTIYQIVVTLEPEVISLDMDSMLICNYSIVPLIVNGNYDSLFWTSPTGASFFADTFYLTALEGNGLIFVQAIDPNGCLTNMDTMYVTSSQLTFDIYQDFGSSCYNDSAFVSVYANTDSLTWTTPFGILDTAEFSFLITDSTSGWYSIQLWDTIGCVYSDSILISPNAIPVFSLTNDTIMCLNDWIEFTSLNDSLTFSWEGFGVVDSIPALENDWYIVTASSAYGCSYTDSVYVTAIDCENELPNVITANGDGTNDFFIIDDALVFTNNKLLIYNRWGEVVYAMERYNNTFDGLDLVDGVYFYSFLYDMQVPDGKFVQGYLHIVR